MIHYYECETKPFKKYPKGMFSGIHSTQDENKIREYVFLRYGVELESIKKSDAKITIVVSRQHKLY